MLDKLSGRVYLLTREKNPPTQDFFQATDYTENIDITMERSLLAMGQKAEIRLDILIKKEEDYYSAHCLQFDLVATHDTLEELKKDIINLCLAHIKYSIENNNPEYLFSPAPQEVWAEYFAKFSDATCEIFNSPLKTPFPAIPPFVIQEIVCHGEGYTVKIGTMTACLRRLKIDSKESLKSHQQ